MNRIAIVLGSNIHWAPYYYRYEKKLNDNHIKFDLIIWNRENIREKNEANKIFEYSVEDVSNNKNPLKIFKFIGFCKFVKKTIVKNKYSKIIFLGTHACAPVFLFNFLKRNYKNKYWIDIRDYQYEWFKPYFIMEKESIRNSFLTVISSKGYEQFLPKYNYKYIHNIDNNMKYFVKEYNKEENNSKIRIGFIGNVRYVNENIKLINIFANDNRYLLQYFGAGAEKIEQYAKKNKIKNVVTVGRFESGDAIKYYNQIDIINNVYGNDSIGLTTALSNKLYFSIYLKIPLLVCENTYMEKIVSKYNIGFVFKDKLSFSNELYIKYKEFKKNNNFENYERIKLNVEKEEEDTFKSLECFIAEWGED